MSNKLKQLRAKEGFTIIEVIIVLVIGAVIMLAVFLVVPQLQRTQRNSARQNAARRAFTALEQNATNNNGVYATASTCKANLDTGAANCPPVADITGAINAPNGSPYTITNDAAPSGLNNMSYVTAGTCTNNAIGGTNSYTGGTNRFFAVQQETAGTASVWCVGN
jgi:prepilin-type N-terminal cleavage/methylation domain-containing protein